MIELVRFLNSEGYKVTEVIPDGRINRFNLDEHDHKKSGYYLAFQNFSPDSGQIFYVIVYGNWKTGEQKTHCTLLEMSRADKKIAQDKINELRKKEEEARSKRQKEISEEVTAKWEKLAAGGSSEYVDRKQIKECKLGIRYDNFKGEIYVPLKDFEGKIWSLQKISRDGEKRFTTGGRVKDCYHVVGGDFKEDRIYFAEGLATAASCSMALGEPVVCCFSAGSLESLPTQFRRKYPNAEIIILGDNDERGREAAEKAAKHSLGTSIIAPEGDWNDAHISHGLEIVANLLKVEKKEKLALYALGFKEGEYFFTSTSNRQVTGLVSFSEDNLCKLMPKEYYEAIYPKEKGGIDWLSAKSDLMEKCRARGIFNCGDVRGSGVWRDNGRIVVNMGDYLIVDGEKIGLGAIKSKYFYTLDGKLDPLHDSPLSTQECQILADTCRSFKWVKKDSGVLLAGSLVLARVCGALPIRPHIWITGSSETGKSTLLESVIKIVLGSNKLYFHGATTEAGVRQILRNSALPIMMDEVETDEDSASVSRVIALVELARIAWSDSGASIAKGGSTGNPMRFQAKGMMFFSSIRPRVLNDADKSRFAMLELAPHGADADHWAMLSNLLLKIDQEYSERLFARTISLVPVILHNFKAIKKELAQKGGSRFGDQYGMLLAGYSTLFSSEPLSDLDAKFFANILDLQDERAQAKVKDYDDSLNHFLTTKVSCERRDYLIGELIAECLCGTPPLDEQKDALLLLGIKVDSDFVHIASNHSELNRQVWKSTRWSNTYAEHLGRLPGALKNKSVWLNGKNTKCVKIPVCYFLEQPNLT